jgi:transposase, IS30 family
MEEYKHFKLMDREKLIILSNQGLTQEAIANQLGFSQSAISRELKRNCSSSTGIYGPEMAQMKAMGRKKRDCKIDRNPELKTHIYEKLEPGWSPDAISNRIKLENGLSYVSHETIYSWLYQPLQKKLKLYKLLTRHKSKRGPRKRYEPKVHKMQDKISIHTRPDAINKREDIGHWEGDLIIGKYYKSQILNLHERKSRFTVIERLSSKRAIVVNNKIDEIGKKLKRKGNIPFLSLTLDNGNEFSEFQQLQRSLGIDIYFCDPYASWQKGGVENANGIIRRTIPKRSDFDKYSDQDINDLIWNINTTPRKCLGYKTPYKVIANKELTLSKLGKTGDRNYALAI